MKLKDLGEFGLIERLRGWLPPGRGPQPVVGLGDDAAVLPVSPGKSVVVAADALVEGVHFRLDWSRPADVGWKAVTVNVSDLAAMGAEPRWVLLSLCAPSSTEVEVLEGIYRGMAEAGEAYGVELVGGDTVRASELVLSVSALGEIEGDPLTRSGAKAGDVLAVSGPLGRAAAGANLLMSQKLEGIGADDGFACLEAHRRPRARVEEGRALKGAGVHAAIDISDGLASDALRIAEASGTGVEIDAHNLPLAPEAAAVAGVRGWDSEKIVLYGGEDFELLVAAPQGSVPEGFLEVGRVVDANGGDDPRAWLVRDGTREELESGWDHFR